LFRRKEIRLDYIINKSELNDSDKTETTLNKSIEATRKLAPHLNVMQSKETDEQFKTSMKEPSAECACEKFDLSRIRLEALAYAETLKIPEAGFGAYHMPQNPTPLLYASCDVAIMRTIMGEELHTELTTDQRNDWISHINTFADADGSYQRYMHHSHEHANGMVIGALGVLGGRQMHPVRLYENFDTVAKVGPWLENVDWQRQWSGSHLFWGGMHCFSMSRHCTEEWRCAVLDWLDAELDPKTGWWRRGVPHAQELKTFQPLGGGAHIWPIYQHNDRRFPLPERVIDSILAMQKPDASWLTYGNYMELDALYGLTYMSSLAPDYRREDILEAAHRHGQSMIKAWPGFLSGAPDLHVLLGAVGVFGLMNQLLPDIYHDTVSWTDIFSDKRLYLTEEVEVVNP
jgi:hypothetical protein